MSVVVALHLGLLQFNGMNRLTQRSPVFESILLLPNERMPDAIPSAASNKKTKYKVAAKNQNQPTEFIKTDSPVDVPAADSNEIDANKSLDWHDAANAAIRQSLQAATAKPRTREFGISSQQPQQAVAPPSPFTQPAHRLGDIIKTANGDDLVWLSENCYHVVNSDAAHFSSFIAGMPDISKTYVKCKKALGDTQSNSHLFDHLKPPPEVAR